MSTASANRSSQPHKFRQRLQTSYDSYMGGSRRIPGIRFENGMETEFKSALQKFFVSDCTFSDNVDGLAGRFPRKSKDLVKRAINEELFFRTTLESHKRQVKELAVVLGSTEIEPGTRLAAIAGLGRNTLLISSVASRKVVTLWANLGSARSVFEAMSVQDEVPSHVQYDPDYGFGNLGELNGDTMSNIQLHPGQLPTLTKEAVGVLLHSSKYLIIPQLSATN
jgi:hypothetical protein